MVSGYALPAANGAARHTHSHASIHQARPSLPTVHSGDSSHFEHHHGHSHDHAPASNGHARTHSPFSSGKSRIRGESDLSRPAGTFGRTAEHAGSTSFVQQTLVATLVPSQVLFASWAYASQYTEFSDHPTDTIRQPGVVGRRPGSPIVFTGLVTSLTLILCGLYGQRYTAVSPLDRRKGSSVGQVKAQSRALSPLAVAFLASGIALPVYAAMHVGGLLAGLVMLVAYGTLNDGSATFKRRLVKSIPLAGALFFIMGLDDFFLATTTPFQHLALGYLSLFISFLLPSPLVLLSASHSSSNASGEKSDLRSGSSSASASLFFGTITPNQTMLAGAAIGAASLITILVPGHPGSFSTYVLGLSVISATCAVGSIHFFRMTSSQTRSFRIPLAGVVSATVLYMIFDPGFWTSKLAEAGLSIIAVTSSFIPALLASKSAASDATVHTGHKHRHAQVSFLTSFLLSHVPRGSLIYDILKEKDSRRIAYFTCLNFAFMMVQGFYGWVSGSLGLLSDTVHMFFDCLALIIGLAASVASKWPTSPEKPYGWGKLNTLAGFGNGVFLMLVSVEFVWSAIEGIMEQKELRRVEELLIVSTLGLIVNMVGLLAFGHAHAGHDHGSHGGHSHGSYAGHDHGSHAGHDHGSHAGHSHGPSHGHDHGDHSTSHHHSHDSHDHRHSHAEHSPRGDTITPMQSHSATPTRAHFHTHSGAGTPLHNHTPTRSQFEMNGSLYPPPQGSHNHSHHGHENDNMHGIYLHIAADAGGSLAVIISTTLTLWKPWYIWDPLATIIIAFLIFMAAVPLVQESAKKLLLVIPESVEYELKNALHELAAMRGVTGFAAPRFWVDDGEGGDSHGHHHHGHSHDHADSGETKLQGAIHVFAARTASMEDVRERVEAFFEERHMHVVVQVEREGDSGCWCGGHDVDKQH